MLVFIMVVVRVLRQAEVPVFCWHSTIRVPRRRRGCRRLSAVAVPGGDDRWTQWHRADVALDNVCPPYSYISLRCGTDGLCGPVRTGGLGLRRGLGPAGLVLSMAGLQLCVQWTDWCLFMATFMAVFLSV